MLEKIKAISTEQLSKCGSRGVSTFNLFSMSHTIKANDQAIGVLHGMHWLTEKDQFSTINF